MDIHIFRSGKDQTLYGFTPDKSGTNLPAPYLPWTYHSVQDMNPSDGPRAGVNTVAVLDGIARNGYYVAHITISVGLSGNPDAFKGGA